MNCPSHYLLYSMKKHSYRSCRCASHTQDILHPQRGDRRAERPHRVAQFQQDDAHILLMESADSTDEDPRLVELVGRCTGVRPRVPGQVRTRPAQRSAATSCGTRGGEPARAVEKTGVAWVENPGDGLLRPQARLPRRDSIGANAAGHIQLDYNAPDRFDLSYVGEDQQGAPAGGHPPRHLRIVRSASSAILIEHYAGNFPVWLAPCRRASYRGGSAHAVAREVADTLRARGLRAELDESSEKLGAKIRDAQLQKIPYTLVWATRRSSRRPSSRAAWRGQGRRDGRPAARRL